ncbi:uncharacterized protein DFL_002478 [Arthrobotrys flagrans]|uniref:Uncharacterized protein n=1 Tax=Arthrobotrys flagrans TaxID=97331 RepID=A0A437AAK3_ARTFL|nr:hypothetical protein DFL_002478 [Arthrobotrys flagrans]
MVGCVGIVRSSVGATQVPARLARNSHGNLVVRSSAQSHQLPQYHSPPAIPALAATSDGEKTDAQHHAGEWY